MLRTLIDLSRRTISPRELQRNGWTRFRERSFQHRDGWQILWCHHPTALYPYELRNPAGKMILTGAANGYPDDYGTAWPSVASAVDYVASIAAAAPVSLLPESTKEAAHAARVEAAGITAEHITREIRHGRGPHLDTGRESIFDSPLFGGPRQGGLFGGDCD